MGVIESKRQVAARVGLVCPNQANKSPLAEGTAQYRQAFAKPRDLRKLRTFLRSVPRSVLLHALTTLQPTCDLITRTTFTLVFCSSTPTMTPEGSSTSILEVGQSQDPVRFAGRARSFQDDVPLALQLYSFYPPDLESKSQGGALCLVQAIHSRPLV